ncbi:Endonuclease/exonuclease/phosphatase [Scheffersomyces coipomensis]|uniref:Endonuclease/exonuclease/phosphatase n=1 Tax=Scheffersomyces coipomensis TaxID=1788519 RepID=UPI00315DEE2F
MGIVIGRLIVVGIREHKAKKELEKQLAEDEAQLQAGIKEGKFKVYTHNVRLDAVDKQPGEQPWPFRKNGVIDSILAHDTIPTLVGLQEVLLRQLLDIDSGLGSEWTYIGVGRDDGKREGEFAPIFYKPAEWDKGWDADHNRIVTVGEFKHKASGKTVVYYNTHFDHLGQLARVNSAKQIIELVNKNNATAVIGGDFNSEPKSETYETLSQSFADTALASALKKGPKFTSTTFDKTTTETRIDYIWVTHDIQVLESEVLSSQTKGFLFSDHRPVQAVLQL